MTTYTYYAHPKGLRGGPEQSFSNVDDLADWYRDKPDGAYHVWRVKNPEDHPKHLTVAEADVQDT